MGWIARSADALRAVLSSSRELAKDDDISNGRIIGGGRPVVPALPRRVDRSEHGDLIVTQVDAWGIPETRGALAQHEIGMFARSSQLADFMTRDDRISSALNTRILGLQSLPFAIEPAIPDNRRAKKIAADLAEDWNWICPPRIQAQLLKWEALMGFALAEIVWNTESKRWIPQLKVWHPQYLYYRTDLRRYVAIAQDGQIFIEPGDGKWLLFSRHERYRAWMDGAIRGLSVPWQARQFSWRDWGNFNEVHGRPIRQAVMPASASDADKRSFFRQIANLGSNAVLMSPRSYDAAGKELGRFALELVEAANHQSWEAFERAMLRGDAAIQLILLGQNMSGGEIQGGSFAAAKVADGVRDDFKLADAQLFGGEIYSQVVRAWTHYNYGDDALTPKPVWDAKPPEDKKKNADTFKTVGEAVTLWKNAGYKIDSERLVEQYAFPIDTSVEPEDPAETPPDGEQTDRVVEFVHSPGQPLLTLTKTKDPTAHAIDGQVYVDGVADKASARGAKVLKRDVLSVVTAAVKRARSYDELRLLLLESFRDLDPSAFQGLVEGATRIAITTGAFSARKEAE